MKTEVLYEQLGYYTGVNARIVRTRRGNLLAQVNHDGRWKRADTAQAATLFRNCMELRLVQPGDKVVAQAGERRVCGTFVGYMADRFEVCVSRDDNVMAEQMLPLRVARQTGAWPFRKTGKVVVWVSGPKFVMATWLGYKDGLHTVKLEQGGRVITSDLAFTAEFANEMGLLR